MKSNLHFKKVLLQNLEIKSLFGSTAVHGKILLVTQFSKNLLILKAASCQTAERTDHARTLF